MVGRFEAFDQHIVDLNFHCFANLILEQGIHDPLIGCPGIPQTKRHYLVAVGPLVSNEISFFFFVFWSHSDLIVTRIGIHEAQHFVACGCVYQLIYLGQRETVLGTGLIKILEIHTHYPLPTVLLYQHHIRQPLGYWTSLMNPARRSFCTSSFMA